MGLQKNVGYSTFPKQGSHLGKSLNVCFNYDTTKIIKGQCVRDDIEEPGRTIIKLEDGRFVMSTECQFQYAKD